MRNTASDRPGLGSRQVGEQGADVVDLRIDAEHRGVRAVVPQQLDGLLGDLQQGAGRRQARDPTLGRHHAPAIRTVDVASLKRSRADEVGRLNPCSANWNIVGKCASKCADDYF